VLTYTALWAPDLPRTAREEILSTRLEIDHDQGIAVKVVQDDRPVVVADSNDEPGLHNVWHRTVGRGSIVATPLHNNDGVSGALVLFEQFPEEVVPGADEPRIFSEKDVPFVTAVADQVSR